MIPESPSRETVIRKILQRLNDLESSPDLYGSTITGSVFQTDLADAGFKIKTDGIRQYNEDGSVGSSWTTDGIDLQGATISGGTISGGIFTGGTFQTADSGDRVVITQDDSGAFPWGQIQFKSRPPWDTDWLGLIRGSTGTLEFSVTRAGLTKGIQIGVNGVILSDDFDSPKATLRVTDQYLEMKQTTGFGPYNGIALLARGYIMIQSNTNNQLLFQNDAGWLSSVGDLNIDAGRVLLGSGSSVGAVFIKNCITTSTQSPNVYMNAAGRIFRIV